MNSKGDSKSSIRNKLNIDSVNTIILKECHNIYVQKDIGLIEIGKSVNLSLLAPKRKITVLLIGNHSAGKSSFINWYVEEHLQKTGVAMETKGFTLVTSGRKQDTLTGNATLHLYPQMKPLQDMKGVIDYLNTRISTSQAKNFPLVNFIDTPGLVDGSMCYPFDVSSTIQWFANQSELIFIFFDPIGQALCKRTMDLIEILSKNKSDRMEYFLSKSDEAGNEIDRQRVMMQIVQELCRRPSLNRHSFDMKTIFIPNQAKNTTKCINQIDELSITIKQTIDRTIQNTLKLLEEDCNNIVEHITEKLKINSEFCKYNNTIYNQLFSKFILCILCTFLIACDTYIVQFIPFYAFVANLITIPLKEILFNLNIFKICSIILGCIGLIIFICINQLNRLKIILTKNKLREFRNNLDYVQKHVIEKKQTLYKNYLDQYCSDKDL